MEEEIGDGIEIVGSAGKGSENSKIEDDNDDQDGYEDGRALPVIAIVSAECESSVSRFSINVCCIGQAKHEHHQYERDLGACHDEVEVEILKHKTMAVIYLF